jgi:DNA gyrase subunit A
VISLSILRKASTRQPRSARIISGRAVEGRRSRTDAARRADAEFEAREEFILTVCANGYGKRTSAYEYRRTNRGGQGITNIDKLGPQRPGRRELPGA